MTHAHYGAISNSQATGTTGLPENGWRECGTYRYEGRLCRW